MFGHDPLEEHILGHEKKVQELAIRLENIEREVSELMNELKVTSEQVTIFINDQNNFTSENWQELQNQRQILEEKLQREIANIRDPQKMKKKQAERNIGQHWLYVR